MIKTNNTNIFIINKLIDTTSSYEPTYGFLGFNGEHIYKYRIITDWDSPLYTNGYMDPLPYAPKSHKVDGHWITAIFYDEDHNCYNEVVVESSITDNPGFTYHIGQITGTYSIPIINLTSFGGQGFGDNFRKVAGHEAHILTNELAPNYGLYSLSQEDLQIVRTMD